jgi:glycosyltransferase involved in cell wall biosynthesis
MTEGILKAWGLFSWKHWRAVLPCVASNVGGIIDVVNDGINGFLVKQKNDVDLAEKIIKLAGDKALREEMGVNGYKFVKKDFNWNSISKNIINIYDVMET